MKLNILLILLLTCTSSLFPVNGICEETEIPDLKLAHNDDSDDTNVIIQNPPTDLEGNYQNYGQFFTMTEYFQNLKTNFAKNHFGSCGLTALTMLLSYYNTFYDSTLIPENYLSEPSTIYNSGDWETTTSPGIKYSVSTHGFAENEEYAVFDETNNEFCPNIRGYIDYTKDYCFDSLLVTYNDYVVSLNAHSYESIVNAYYGTDKFTMYKYYSTNNENNTVFFENVVRTLLDQDIPVILRMDNGKDTIGHAVVAHSYDEENIYCNMGWFSSTTSEPYTDRYSRLYGIFYIYPNTSNLNHVHSKSYLYNNLIYCGCGEHVHTYSINRYNSGYHSYVCACGETHYEKHTSGLFCGVCSNPSINPGGPILG